ncbi:MAG: Membrane protein insertase YidC [Acidobacteria bacterium]|jgi:YidC/Oxa1 family membrane protein insertase|nr:Membrane protein insertase YidC [Acidobacteriota bacterium]
MDNSKQQNQTRFLLAALLSMAVLFGWSYFFAPEKTPTDNANTAQVVDTSNTPAPAAQPNQPQIVQPAADEAPNKQITVKSPLYEVKLDSKGALATSWILLKNTSPHGEKPLFAAGSTAAEQLPLQLISQKALDTNNIPFRLSTDDQNLNTLLNSRNYQVSAAEDTITLGEGQERQIDFILTDASGVAVTKSFVFRADSYVADLQVKLTRNDQPVPNTKLLIGASIGDHAINHHNFYQIESEAVAAVNDDIVRHQGYYSFTYDANSQSSLAVDGKVDWAGIGDAYFAMVAIPATQNSGLEFKAEKYEVDTKPYYDGIFSWITRSEKTKETRHLVTAYLPINADGSTTKVYTGTKDYFALNAYNDVLTKSVGRPIDVVDIINFSNYSIIRPITKYLSIPILSALNFFNNFTHNYGVAIIIFTFLFYSLLFPLRWSQSRSFKKAAANAPKMKEIQDKIKDFQKKGIPIDDPRMRELQMEQLRMTKSALPIGGCLPMLLQFPLLIAFYTAVTVSLGIRQASFLWLPDLSVGDPYHLLEFAFAASMILSMKFTPQAAIVTPEQQMQQKLMTYFMPIMMLWVMWSAPAGLLIYWFFGNVVSFGQQLIINRMNKTGEPPKEEIVDSMPKNVKKVKPKLSTS